MMASYSIKTVSARNRLLPRREPYWEQIGHGCYLGFRYMTAGSNGTWVARWCDPVTLKRPTHPLGDLSEYTDAERYARAKAAAETWFIHMGRGGTHEAFTVRQVVEGYVASLRSNKGDKAADDAESRLERLVLGDAKLANMEVGKLTHAHFNAWREKLLRQKKTASTTNRDLTAFRAALNHALHAGWVTSDGAWSRALIAVQDEGNRRTIYLDQAQRRKLAEHCPADLQPLMSRP